MTATRDLLETWMKKPIAIRDNPALPGRKFGDDCGYREMRTLRTNPSPFATPSIELRADYDGFCPYTGQRNRRRLGGGLKNNAFVLREAAARSVSLADSVLRQVSGGQLVFVGLDAYRSGERQWLGYSEKLLEQMAMISLTTDDVANDRRIAEFIGCSMRADGVFSWVKVIKDGAYATLIAELRQIPAILEGARQYAADKMTDGATEDNVSGALYEYVIACCNARIGRAAGRGTLVWECNAHAGGGAVDLMILSQGILKAITPFDWPGFMSAFDFLENSANFDIYRKALAASTILQEHLRLCGYKPSNFTWANWVELRDLKRVQFHLAEACGWTFYSMGADGGEHWHHEPSNLVIDPLTREIQWTEEFSGTEYPRRGNPGHSLQLFGEQDIAVWGGASALEIVTTAYGFE